jgi:hypothetical protein
VAGYEIELKEKDFMRNREGQKTRGIRKTWDV